MLRTLGCQRERERENGGKYSRRMEFKSHLFLLISPLWHFHIFIIDLQDCSKYLHIFCGVEEVAGSGAPVYHCAFLSLKVSCISFTLYSVYHLQCRVYIIYWGGRLPAAYLSWTLTRWADAPNNQPEFSISVSKLSNHLIQKNSLSWWFKKFKRSGRERGIRRFRVSQSVKMWRGPLEAK